MLTPVGSNQYCSHKYEKLYFEDHICAQFARYLRISNPSEKDVDIEKIFVVTISTNYLPLPYLSFLYTVVFIKN